MIAIIDYGVGNVGSIINMLKKVGAKSTLTKSINEIQNAEKIILPGVGHFGAAMEALNKSGLIPTIENQIFKEKKPILGICVGMQLMADKSEEGGAEGLGWIPGTVKHFSNQPEGTQIRIPHMGWNKVIEAKKSPLINEFNEKTKFYFVHSYYYECSNQKDTLLSTNYGKPFASAIQKGNIMGVQFHPEKSHKYGMRLMSNFVGLDH